MHEGWKELLASQFKKDYYHDLEAFLQKERQKKLIYPSEELVFHAFNYFSPSETKIVIVGQDPYHTPHLADGLAFSCEKIWPPSLKNIIKEMIQDLKIEPPKSGSLVSWARQGVLLLNNVLTVEAHKPTSHHNKGWEIFTDYVIEQLSKEQTPKVFMLWGSEAQEKESFIEKPHRILRASHPSPFSSEISFTGSHPFSRANRFLIKHGREPVDWQL